MEHEFTQEIRNLQENNSSGRSRRIVKITGNPIRREPGFYGREDVFLAPDRSMFY